MKHSIILLLLFIATYAVAQTPQAIHYQGIARTTTGQPIADKEISLRLTIRNSSPSGPSVYAERHQVTTNRFGLFNIAIGNGNTVSGQFENIYWGGTSHFAEVEMDENGGQDFTSIGTTQLLAVPYALHAARASTADGPWQENGTNLNYSGGQVGIGTASPDHALHIVQNEATGAERFLINLHNQDTGDRSLSGMVISSGSGAGLTTVGHHATTYNLQDNYFSDHGQLMTSGKGLVLRVDNEQAAIKFLTGLVPGQSSPERMRIDKDGNVGIGTSNPTTKLQVTDGDVFIENINSGVIMKSPDGRCWRVTVSNTGVLQSAEITCPN